MLGLDLWEVMDKHYDVYGTDIVDHRPETVDKKFIVGDITDYKSISGILKKIVPDIVIHTAAWTDVDGCEIDRKKAYKVNFFGTKNVALACRNTGALLFYISTDFVFDGKKKQPYKENDIPNPINIYSDSKFKGEEALKKILKKYIIIRTSWLYGSCGKNFVDTIISKTKSEKTLKIVDDQIGSPTYTKDLAKAIHRLLDKMRPKTIDYRPRYYGIYHVSNSGSVSWYKYAKEILRLTGSKTKVIPISSDNLDRPAKRPAMSILDNSKFKRFTGYKMRNWKYALKEYLSKER